MKTITQPDRQRGVAAVELALILPIMLILVFGITEIGRALYQYNGLVKATRGAARYLSQYDLADADVAAEVRNNTIRWAVYGAPTTCSGAQQLNCTFPTSPLVSGLKVAQVSLCDYQTCIDTHKGVLTGQGPVDLVTVSIGGTGDMVFSFKSMMSYVIPDIDFKPIRMTMASVSR